MDGASYRHVGSYTISIRANIISSIVTTSVSIVSTSSFVSSLPVPLYVPELSTHTKKGYFVGHRYAHFSLAADLKALYTHETALVYMVTVHPHILTL